jgi:hypothetical protein
MDSNTSLKEREHLTQKIHIHTTDNNFWKNEEYTVISEAKRTDNTQKKY